MTLVCECDGTETHLKRKIDHAGVSHYRIDGKAVKWEQYAQKLKGAIRAARHDPTPRAPSARHVRPLLTRLLWLSPSRASFSRAAMGVLTKAHVGFLVFQGYVSELAAKSPRELTALFEQVGGVGGVG